MTHHYNGLAHSWPTYYRRSDDVGGRGVTMTLEEKDAYIAEHLMKLEPDTLRFMVADLTAEVERLSNILSVDSKDWTALEESLIASRAERDKYKTALEEIHGLYPDTNPPGVILARGIARNALTK